MTYTPNNAYIFANAFAGAQAAFSASSPGGLASSAAYSQQSSAALAVATAVDMAWGAQTPNAMDVAAMAGATTLILRDRAVFPFLVSFTSPLTWATIAQQIVAAVQSGDITATAAGIVFPPITGGSGVVGPINVLTFQPGGTAGPNRFTTWSALYAQAQLTTGPIWVNVDTTFGAAVVPSGTYNVDNWTFTTGASSTTVKTLSFATGALLVFSNIRVNNGLNLTPSGTTSPITDASGPISIFVDGPAGGVSALLPTKLLGTASAPLVAIATNTINSITARGADVVIGDGTHAAITVAAAKSLELLGLEGVTLSNNYASGSGTVVQTCDAATSFGTLGSIGTNVEEPLDGGLLQTANATGTGTTVNGTLATVVGGGTTVAGGAGGRTVILTGSGWVQNLSGSGTNFIAKLLVAGAVVDVVEFNIAVGANGSFSFTCQAALAAGSNAIDLQVSGPGSASGTADNCNLVALVVNV